MSGEPEKKKYPRTTRRITVQLDDELARHLDAVCAASSERAAITPSAAVRAAIALLPAQGHAPDPSAMYLVTGSSSTCQRVHADEAEVHRLRVELGREGGNLMQLVRRANSNVDVRDAEVVAQLRATRALLDELRELLGAST